MDAEVSLSELGRLTQSSKTKVRKDLKEPRDSGRKRSGTVEAEAEAVQGPNSWMLPAQRSNELSCAPDQLL